MVETFRGRERGRVHRTLQDYAEALRDAGFLIARIEEPTPTPEALERMYHHFADYRPVPLFFFVEAIRPLSMNSTAAAQDVVR